MRSKTITLLLLIAVFLSSCAPQTTNTSPTSKGMKASEMVQPVPPTELPTETSTPEPTITPTSIPTSTPTRAPEVITKENANRLELLASFGHGRVETKAAISPDHKLIAVAGTIGVLIYDSETLELTKVLKTDQTAHSVAFSPDGSKVAIGMPNPLILESRDTRITSLEIWDVQSETRLNRFEDYDQFWNIRAVTFSHDGCEVIDWSKTVHNICTNTSYQKAQKDWRNPSAVQSPDGTRALVYQGGWSVWDTKEGKKLKDIMLRADLEFQYTYILDGFPIYNQEGTSIASYKDDKIYITDPVDFKLKNTFKLSTPVKALVYSPDGQYIAAFGKDNKIHLVSSTKGDTIGETEELPYIPIAITFSADSKFLISMDDYTNFFRWSTPNLQIDNQKTYLPFTAHAAFSPDGKLIAITTRNYSHISKKYSPSTVEIIDATTYKSVFSLEEWDPDPKMGIYIGGLAFSPDGKTLAASASCIGIVYLWDVSSGKLIRTLEIAPGKKLKDSDLVGCIEGIDYSPDGKTLAATNTFVDRLYFWDVETGKITENYKLPKFKDFRYPVRISEIKYAKDMTRVVLGSGFIWDLQKKEWGEFEPIYSSYPIQNIKRYSNEDNFEFNADHTKLMQFSRAGVVNLWHIK